MTERQNDGQAENRIPRLTTFAGGIIRIVLYSLKSHSHIHDFGPSRAMVHLIYQMVANRHDS